jgi:hypothetical protein
MPDGRGEVWYASLPYQGEGVCEAATMKNERKNPVRFIVKGAIISSAIVLWTFLDADLSFAAGISTRFGDVTVTNLRVGNRYSMREVARLPLVIENKSNKTIDLRIDVLAPADNELKPGYEPIPDISWIQLEKRELKIGPGMYGQTDVFIDIPDNSEFEDQKYQVYIWSHTVGGAIGLGLKSRLRFDTISENSAAEKESGEKAAGTFEFEANPLEIVLEKVTPGRSFDVEKETGIVFKIRNNAKESRVFKVESIRVSDSYAELPKGFLECPYPSFLLLETEPQFTLPAGIEKQIPLYVNFPDKEEYRGKNYLFLIHILQESVGIYSKVYVSTVK